MSSYTFISLLYLLVTKSFLNIIKFEKNPMLEGGWRWRHLAAATTTIPPRATRGNSELLPWFRVSTLITSFCKNRQVEQMQL